MKVLGICGGYELQRLEIMLGKLALICWLALNHHLGVTSENNESGCEPQNSEKNYRMFLVKSILTHLEVPFKFFLCQFFSANTSMLSL